MRIVLVQPQLSHDAHGDENLQRTLRSVRACGADPGAGDVLVLPERHHSGRDMDGYEQSISTLARQLGCSVVGGSHHQSEARGAVHRGVACDAEGTIVGRYEKLNPYGHERSEVRAGEQLGTFVLEGMRVQVLICADFWFAETFRTVDQLPDVVLVPALSVTRKPGPEYSRSLWRHLAIARAYEYGVYVGISDWAHPSDLPVLFASGVAGFADPTTTDPSKLFGPVPNGGAASFEVDLRALRDFREDRRARGFFWQPGSD